MSEQSAALVEATIRQQCKALHMPTIGSQFVGLALEAIKAKQSHTEYLEVLLAAETRGARTPHHRATCSGSPFAQDEDS